MTGFIDDPTPEGVHVFLQWKGTDACFDFYCDCGAHCHFDGDFAYVVKCPHCQTLWEMPCILIPRKATDLCVHVDTARLMTPDMDFQK